jgi:hypothetical protein
VSGSISDSDQIIASVEFVNSLDSSDSTNVVTFHTISQVSNFHFVNTINSSSFEVQFNCVLDLDLLGKEFKSSTIVGNKVADLIWSNELLLNSAKLEVFLLTFEWNEFESSFDVIKNSESFVKFWKLDSVHKTARIFRISSDFLIDQYKTFFLVKNGVNFGSIESNSKLVSKDNLDWDRLSEFVWTLGWSDSINTSKFVHHPGFGGCDSLQMFLWSSCHYTRFINFLILSNLEKNYYEILCNYLFASNESLKQELFVFKLENLTLSHR